MALVVVVSLAIGGVVETAIQNGADRLVSLQNNDGGWDWPLDDGDPNNFSPKNTIGPIAMGLAKVYGKIGFDSYHAALQRAGDLLLAKTNNFSPPDGYLAAELDKHFKGKKYKKHVQKYFYKKLKKGTYNRNGAGVLYNTAGYVNLIRDARFSQGIANLAAWDIGMGLVGAASIGADISAWVEGVKAEIDELDGNESCDVIGLAGALYGLAFVNEDYDSVGGEHEAASSLSDLAEILVGYQIDVGGFTWNSFYVIPDDFNETVQETSYAILALNEFDRSYYISNIRGAVDYLLSVQLPNGGWKNWDGGGENNEVTAEALWAICIGDGYKMSPFLVEKAKIEFKKKTDDDKINVKGKFELASDSNGVENYEDVIVTIGQFSETINMNGKGHKWEYKRQKGETGIKEMKIEWKKHKEAKFSIKIDKVDLGDELDWNNPIMIRIQIGDDLGSETITMKVKKDKWEYKK